MTHTDPDCTYDGEWNFEHNGIEYTVLVEEQKEIDIVNEKKEYCAEMDDSRDR